MPMPTTPTASKHLTKTEILTAVSKAVGDEVSQKDVKAVVEALVKIGHQELRRIGRFIFPGLAKFIVVRRAARPAREWVNPFTRQAQTFAAKPARKSVKARPVKAVKDAVAEVG
jgi:DNA-binding protein HU-beta